MRRTKLLGVTVSETEHSYYKRWTERTGVPFSRLIRRVLHLCQWARAGVTHVVLEIPTRLAKDRQALRAELYDAADKIIDQLAPPD